MAETTMTDLLFIAGGVAIFAIFAIYTLALRRV
jgi:hypothetical protein